MCVVSHSQWLFDLDLHLPISCPHVSLHSFLLGLTQTTFFLTLSESLREANAHSLKMFSSESFLILLLFLSDSLEWKIYRPFLWCFLGHLKLFYPCVPCYIVTGDWCTVWSHLVCLPCSVIMSPILFNIPQSMNIGWGWRNLHNVLYWGSGIHSVLFIDGPIVSFRTLTDLWEFLLLCNLIILFHEALEV